jgi:hypothetical protein
MSNIIVINRGDSFDFDLTIALDSEFRYALTGDDALYFGIMHPHQPFETALIRKKYTVADTDEMGNLSISILPEDTLNLHPGKYYYAVKLHMNHPEVDANTGEETGKIIDKVYTIINKTKFIICD